MNDFYIGYLPKAPDTLSRHVRKIVFVLKLTAVALALALVALQQPFTAAAFEFLEWREFGGVVQEHPYPALRLAHPGGESSYLLVRPGKHGAGDLVRGLDGQSVRLSGQLIYRGAHTMLEVEPRSVVTLDGRPAPALEKVLLQADVVLAGEIVDSKCYLGVMNPSTGKVHRDCAARCISGGLPPALLVASGGGAELYLLVSEKDAPLGRELLPRVAEPVQVRGAVVQQGPYLLLRTNLERITARSQP